MKVKSDLRFRPVQDPIEVIKTKKENETK